MEGLEWVRHKAAESQDKLLKNYRQALAEFTKDYEACEDQGVDVSQAVNEHGPIILSILSDYSLPDANGQELKDELIQALDSGDPVRFYQAAHQFENQGFPFASEKAA